MAHLAFYRKWRPKTFDQVYGQEYVVQTLKNEIAAGKPSHAYLFTGSRGTGKTTIAKILAKAVNCTQSKDGNPCLTCDSCLSIERDTTLDVVEMDAASNNGVDYIRQLREEAIYPPTVCKYRVYIIDEVHMLSNSAFNALLKIMEEPPAHVIFILATTEVEQVPATILSRCQRFDFRRIPDEAICRCLTEICQKEALTAQEDALATIARLSDGGLRDAVSLLDQCAGSAGEGGQITKAAVLSVAFAAGRDPIYRITACMADKTPVPALQELAALYKDSKNMTRLTAELIDFFRLMMLIQVDPNLADSPLEEENETAKRLAAKFTQQQIFGVLQQLEECYARQKHTTDPKMELEIVLISLCDKRQSKEPDVLLARLEKLEQQLQNTIATQKSIPMASQTASAAVSQPSKQPDTPKNPAQSPSHPVDTPPWDDDVPLPDEPPTSSLPDPDMTYASPESAENTPATPCNNHAAKKTENIGGAEPAACAECSGSSELDWPDVLDALQNIDAPLAGMLAQSEVNAALANGVLTVDVGDFKLAGVLLGQDSHRTCLQQATAQVMGIAQPRVILASLNKLAPAKQAQSPLEDYLSKAKASGIEIEMESD